MLERVSAIALACARRYRGLLLGPFVVVVAMGSTRTVAQTDNSQVSRIIVPIAAGATTDVVARLIADRIRTDLSRNVIVENRPGATGRIALDALKNASPDGTTLLLAPIAVPVIVPLVFANANFDPARDLVPISQIATYEFALAVAPDHPARSLPEFIAWADANRLRATYGTAGVGSAPHLLGTMLAKAANIQLAHIPYRGLATMEAEVMSGQIAATFALLSEVVALHRGGKLRLLATSGPQRSPLAPDVHTFREDGFAAVEAMGWLGLYAPARTPRAVIDRLASEISTAVRSNDVQSRMLALGLTPTATTPDELTAIMGADIARWRQMIRTSGFTAE